MHKRREDVVYTSAAIMNRPKPKAPKVPTTEPQTEQPKKEDEEMKAENEDGGPTIEEMDVD
jgi:heat shock protein 4